jgi:hypothetical protein
MVPWRAKASMAYWEQVGEKRQLGAKNGEIHSW